MQTNALKQEKQYLKISALGNVLVGCIGIAVAAVSSSQAIMLDGMFNLTYFATGLFTIKVASLVAGGDDERSPHGYAFFEPLVNGIKGMLVLGVFVSNSPSGRHWELDQTTAMGYATHIVKRCALDDFPDADA